MYSYIYRKALSATGSLRHIMPAKKKGMPHVHFAEAIHSIKLSIS